MTAVEIAVSATDDRPEAIVNQVLGRATAARRCQVVTLPIGRRRLSNSNELIHQWILCLA